jgi:UDP-GlcNAc3NAcA epimerase
VKKGVYNVGDVMYDIFLKGIKIAKRKSKILKKLKLRPKEYFLLTLHRPRNVDKERDLKIILETLAKSKEKIIFPVHPRTKKNIKKFNFKIEKYPNILFIKPVGYLDMLILEKNAKKILTDSGGIQKESSWLKVPCITLRDKTEWRETIKDGWNVLVDKDKEKIFKAINKFKPKGSQRKHFGGGKAAQKITKILIRNFNDQ